MLGVLETVLENNIDIFWSIFPKYYGEIGIDILRDAIDRSELEIEESALNIYFDQDFKLLAERVNN